MTGSPVAPMTSSSWMTAFVDPPIAYRTVPFWSWNERMEPAEVGRQVGLIKQAGWGGAFLHSRVGLLTPYLGDEWFDACRAAIVACKAEGLNVWLYDEDGWPSGFSGGSVPLADEAYRQKALFARPAGAPAPERSVPIGPPQHGLQVYHWTAPLGSWRFNGTSYADLLSRAAMAKFIEHAYASYHNRFADDYGDPIVAQFLDEPCAVVHVLVPAGSLPYTDALCPTFEQQHGYDPRPHLHKLFADVPGAQRFRLHYFRTASWLFEHHFTKQIGDWCGEHGISLTGHYMEGGLYDEQAWGNAIPQNYRHQHIPGIDHLCMQVDEVVTAKRCHAVVNQLGKPRMLCETYGAAGQHMSFADRWWVSIHLLSLGVNLINSHLCLYTMAGERKRDWPPNLYYQQPWFEANDAIETPLSRLCVALAQGTYVAEALVLHPYDSAAALWRARTDWPQPDALQSSNAVTGDDVRRAVDLVGDDFNQVVRSLLAAQHTFDVGDETVMADISSVGTCDGRPRVRVGKMSYAVVIVPTMRTMMPATFDLLRRFRSAGGSVLLAGEPPPLLDGERSDEAVRFFSEQPRFAPAEVANALRSVVAPLVTLDAYGADVSSVFAHIRDLGCGDRLVFLADRRRIGTPMAATVRLAGAITPPSGSTRSPARPTRCLQK